MDVCVVVALRLIRRDDSPTIQYLKDNASLRLSAVAVEIWNFVCDE